MCCLVLAEPCRLAHNVPSEAAQPPPGCTEQVSPIDPELPVQAAGSRRLCPRVQTPLLKDSWFSRYYFSWFALKYSGFQSVALFHIPFTFEDEPVITWADDLLVTKLHIIWDTTIRVLRASKLGIMMTANGPDPSSSVHSYKHKAKYICWKCHHYIWKQR